MFKVDLETLADEGPVIVGASEADFLGVSVSDAGDINGDGLGDIIVSSGSGQAYVVFGRTDGWSGIDLNNLQPSQGFEIVANAYHSITEVSAAGDLNGDGFDDIVLGGAFYYGWYGFYDVGWVIFGKNTNFGTVDVTNLSPSEGYILWGNYGGNGYGLAVSSAGDINGDGFDDLIVGAPYGWYGAGTVYVVFGTNQQFPHIVLSNMIATQGFDLIGQVGLQDFAGFSVSNAGDINGDGYDDIIIGAPYGDLGGEDSGQAYIVFGKGTPFGTIDLSNMAAGTGFVIVGDKAGDNAGWSVSGAGDVNGDGYDDIVIGAASADGNHELAGAVYVIFGKAGGFGTIDLTNLAASAGFTILGDDTADHAGFAVSRAGDVNNDGYDDIIIGAPENDNTRNGTRITDAGEAYVIFGRASGFGTIDLTNLSPADGFVVQGAAPYDLAGFSVSGAGDVDGDGFDDLIIGAPMNDRGGWDAGAAYILSMGLEFAIKSSPDFNGDGRDDILWRNESGLVGEWLGQANGSFANNAAAYAMVAKSWTVASTGDFNGDGRDDILWRNDNGLINEWLSLANGSFAHNPLANALVSEDWHVADTGDFNGDGRDDILWRNSDGVINQWLGQLNGTFVNNPVANAVVSADWQIATIGDFDGDGDDDIMWRNGDGVYGEWLGQADGSFANNAAAYGFVPTDWHIVGAGDFNGDGRDDLLWRSDTGGVVQWLGQANGSFAHNPVADAIVPNNWRITGIGDYNGDGRDDVLWRNGNGLFNQWLSQADGSFVHNPIANAVVPLNWHVQSPDILGL